MKGEEIARKIAEGKKNGAQFISWWRREQDWLEFELIDNFLRDVKPDEEIEGYSLVGMDGALEHVRNLAGDRVKIREGDTGTYIFWRRPNGRELTCPLTADSVIRIIDVESRGNFVDG